MKKSSRGSNLVILEMTFLLFLFFVCLASIAGANYLGNQTYETDITILNVQSYPSVGGNWTVRFDTSGKADLAITAVDGTEFGRDLEFLEVRCGDEVLDYEWVNNSVFIEDYECGETGYGTSKVLTAGKHTLNFRFGDDVEYAYNLVNITKAMHLDENKTFISDIYNEVRTLDNVWSETIPDQDYVRVVFERPLDSSRDITLYPRVVSGTPRVEVYEVDGTELITEFTSLTSNEYNKVFLTNLQGTQDTFDLRIIGGSLEINHVVDPPWFNTSFDRCRNITLTNAGSSTLTDFPFYINITNTTDMLPDYSDLRFVNTTCNNGGSQLDHEIENYTASDVDVWVRIPSLPAAGTNISVYYKNNTAVSDAQNPTGVWDSNYMGVWHLIEDPGPGSSGDIKDSTSYGNDGTAESSMTTSDQVAGKIDGSIDLDGADDYMTFGNDVSVQMDSSSWTLEAWVNTSDSSTDGYGDPIMEKEAGGAGYQLTWEAGGNDWFQVMTGGASNTEGIGGKSLGQWYYVVGVFDTNEAWIYVDGIEEGNEGSKTYTADTGRVLRFGAWGTSRELEAIIDEVRISNISRSADWINQSYQMVVNQATYAVFGTEEISNEAPTTPTNIQCDGSNDCNISVDASVDLNASGSTDVDNDNITYFIEASLQNTTTVQDTTDVSKAVSGGGGAVVSVEEYVLTLSGTSASANLRNNQNFSNSVPFATMSRSGNDYWNSLLPEITFASGPDRVIATRDASDGTITVLVTVVEFDPDKVKVQSGTFTITGSSDTDTITEAVTVANSGLVFYHQSDDGGDDYDDNSVEGNISSPTQVSFRRETSVGSDVWGTWYVFESLDGGFTSQIAHIEFSSSSATSRTATISSVDTSKTFLIASGTSDLHNAYALSSAVIVNLTNPTTITAYRGNGGSPDSNTININIFAITFTGSENVQRGTLTYSGGTGTDTDTITEVDLDTAMVWNPMLTGMMESDSGSQHESSWNRLNLTGTTTVQGDRDETGGATRAVYEVVEWVTGGGASNETNTTSTNYTDVNSDFKSINNITVKVEVDSYDPRASVNQSTNDPDLWLEIWNSTHWIAIGEFDLNESYTGNGLNTTNANFSLTTTDSTILTAWQTSSNQDFNIKGIYMDHNSTIPDEINYTNVWVTINGVGWTVIGNHTNVTTFAWNTTDVTEQTCIDLRTRAIDLDGSNTYSGYYNKGSCLNISHAAPVTSYFNCSIVPVSGTCAGDNTTILYLENDTGGYWNAHAQNVSVGTYDYVVCCNCTSNLSFVCNEGMFLKLNATTNSHVQRWDYSGPGIVYGVDVCLTADPGYFNCTYVDDSCPANSECFASMASAFASENNDTNAHIGPCEEYKRKVCCRVIPSPTVIYRDPTPGNNSRQAANSVTIKVSVSADSDVNADTCILEWKVDEGSPTNYTMEMIGSGSSVTCNMTQITVDATNYTFKVYANDSVGNWENESVRQFRENDEPDKVVLTSPPDGNHTTNRTPAFQWNVPNDADGDTLNYTINITCFGGCSDDNRYVEDLSTNSTTLTQELQYFGDDNYYYNWSVRAGDGYEYGQWSDERNLTIDTNVSMIIVNDTVDFGENRIPGYEDNTTDNSPYPFSLRNIGNCMIDVNLSSDDLLWDVVSQPSDYFNYSVGWVPGEEGAFNWSGSQTSPANIPQVDQNVTFMDYLNYTSGNSSAEIDMYIEVPPGELVGPKSSNITFTGEYHKPS